MLTDYREVLSLGNASLFCVVGGGSMNRRIVVAGIAANVLALPVASIFGYAQAAPGPEAVSFPSLDGHTKLVGYLFPPTARRPGPAPAVVLLHGRAGPYSILADGHYNAATLSKRHVMWASFWAGRGCFALVVDSFGPRGLAAGFAAGTHTDRPPEINEVTVRPLDAYGALNYLASRRRDVDPGRVGLQGWSNGGSATLATMATSTLQSIGIAASAGFRAGLAFYPGCGLEDRFRDGYAAYAPVQVLIGTADEEVSLASCELLAKESQRSGNPIAMTVYPKATHDFDDPGQKRQSVAANVAAVADSMPKAAAFMGQHLRL
jgi:dienelactone hydrolase